MSALPFSYRAYGLTIRSDLALPELASGGEGVGADVVVRFGAVAEEEAVPRVGNTTVRIVPEGMQLAYPEVGRFLVREGREVVVALRPGADERDVRLSLLGPVLAVLLHQRGLLVLHGSAVALGDGAVGLLGHAGAGKSTLAGAFLAAGYRPLADDLTVVDLTGPTPTALPGFPQLKLWPQSVTALGGNPETLPALGARVEKRARRLAAGFAPEPLPLRRLYVIADGERVASEPLAGQEALVELVRHSFCAVLLPAGGQGEHFRQCAALLRMVPLSRLARPKEFAALPAIIRAIAGEAGDGDR
ncbi:MAG: hypothetical protein U0232_02535 [Thermomicrobiales bacterium]